jgi:hypothetical protein
MGDMAKYVPVKRLNEKLSAKRPVFSIYTGT